MRRPALIALIALLSIIVLGVVAWQFALRQLKSAVESALGPRATIGAIDVGFSAVDVHELRLRGEPRRWPAEDELRAARIRIVPDLGSVWGALFGRGVWRLQRVEVDDAYLSLLRTRDGSIRLLPGLLDRPAAKGPDTAPGAPALTIATLRVRGAVDLFDASLRNPPHRLQMHAVDAELGPLVLPAQDTPVEMKVSGLLRAASAKRNDGRIELRGRLTPATRDADLQATARGVDLLVLAPYIVRASDVAVKAGTLDLELRAKVQAKRLQAPGRLVLTGLELGGGRSGLGTFAGVPAGLVLGAMARDGRLEVPFSLQGRIDDPSFSLNADFASRLALGLAEKLGVNVGGVVQGIAEGIKGLLGKK